MSHRHQAFLIARVDHRNKNGETITKYRCIAAIEHDWCHGVLPLEAAYRFSNLAKERGNATILREELRTYADNTETNPEAPCPYALFLLRMAFSFGREGEDGSSATPFSARTESTRRDNDDGITIIDVTDPENLALCYVLVSDDADPKPLTSDQYLRTYHPKPARAKRKKNAKEKGHTLAIARLRDTPLVSLASLAEAWPSEFLELDSEAAWAEFKGLRPDVMKTVIVETMQKTLDKQHADGQVEYRLDLQHAAFNAVLDDSARRIAKLMYNLASSTIQKLIEDGKITSDKTGKIVMASEAEDPHPNVASGVPAILSPLHQSVEQALEKDNFEALESSIYNDVIPDILARLQQSRSFSYNAVEFLSKALQGRGIASEDVNFSGYALTGDQVVKVLAGRLNTIQFLDLSDNAKLHVDDLVVITTSIPRLTCLNILRTSVSSDDLHTLFTRIPAVFHNVDRILHPFFFQDGDPNIPYPSAMSFVVDFGGANVDNPDSPPQVSISAPIVSPKSVAKMILDFVGAVGEPNLRASSAITPDVLLAGVSGAHPLEDGPDPPVLAVPFIPRVGVSPEFREEGYVLVFSLVNLKPGSRYAAFRWQYGIYYGRKVGGKLVEEIVDIPTFFSRLQQGFFKASVGQQELQPLLNRLSSKHYLQKIMGLDRVTEILIQSRQLQDQEAEDNLRDTDSDEEDTF